MLSESVGEKPVLVGEAEWDDGVGRPFGDADTPCGGGSGWDGSLLGAMLEFGLRWWWRFMMALCIGGGCTRF